MSFRRGVYGLLLWVGLGVWIWGLGFWARGGLWFRVSCPSLRPEVEGLVVGFFQRTGK